jgi:rare lipoprotein A (peptidoglycan hydrolase)
MTRVFAASLMMFVGSLSMAHADLAPLQSLGAASDSAPLASQALDSAAVTPSSPRAITLASNDSDSMMDRMSTLASQTVRKFSQAGLASWYGRQFNGRKTASGERFDMNGLTAAHRSLPLSCYIRVTNRDNGKSVVVKVNDRGPFHASRILDLSYGAAQQLGITQRGTGNVTIERVAGPDAE